MVLKSVSRRFCCLSMLLLALPFSTSAAVQVDDLYDATEVITVGASSDEQRQLMAKGLAQVFAKVSGDENVVADDGINGYLKDAQSYLLSFSFEPNDEKRVNALGEVVDTQKLKMSFDSSRVNSSLTSQGFPVWGARRPEIMVWIASDNNGVREILSGESHLDLANDFRQLADARGLPVIFPHLDLEDQLTLDVSELWGLFPEAISKASSRYNPDAILAGRVEYLSEHQWRSEWLFVFNGEQRKLSINGDSRQDMIDQILAQVSSRLASQYAVYLNSMFEDQVTLRISGIKTLAEYHSVLQYVGNMTGVKSSTVTSVAGNVLKIKVDVSGDTQQLRDLIALDSHLVQEEYLAPAGTPAAGNELRYAWAP